MHDLGILQVLQIGSKVMVTAVLAALAAWLLVLDVRNRIHRVFALILVVQAGVVLSYGFAIGHDHAAYWAGRVYQRFSVALPFAALYGAWVFCLRYGGLANRRLLGNRALVPGLLLAGAAVPQYVITVAGAAMDRDTRDALGLIPVAGGLAMVLVAFLLARAAWAQARHVKRRALLLASLGFLLLPAFDGMYEGGLQLTDWILHGTDIWSPTPYNLQANASLAMAAAAVLVAVHVAARAGPGLRALGARYVVALAATLVLGGLGGFGLAVAGSWEALAPSQIMHSLSRLALPLLVCYALVKHHLFDVDARVVRGIGWSFAGGLVLAAFFIGSGLIQAMVGGSDGDIVGGAVVSGLLLLFVSPLERIGRRLARRAVPTPTAKADAAWSASERSAIYRDQVELAWLDGQLSLKEHRLLQALRERLGLSPDEAATVESAAARDTR